jgi:hypothetical protein
VDAHPRDAGHARRAFSFLTFQSILLAAECINHSVGAGGNGGGVIFFKSFIG